jgi:hypothetical protein
MRMIMFSNHPFPQSPLFIKMSQVILQSDNPAAYTFSCQKIWPLFTAVMNISGSSRHEFPEAAKNDGSTLS